MQKVEQTAGWELGLAIRPIFTNAEFGSMSLMCTELSLLIAMFVLLLQSNCAETRLGLWQRENIALTAMHYIIMMSYIISTIHNIAMSQNDSYLVFKHNACQLPNEKEINLQIFSAIFHLLKCPVCTSQLANHGINDR